MRDIGRRIQRYRLSRYRAPQGSFPRPPGWVWLVAALWLAYVGVVSERSLYRIWRMGDENARAQRELARVREEIMRLDKDARDPKSRLRDAERALRREGFARPGELIYRIESALPDTSKR
jgi:cell division protein FtsB